MKKRTLALATLALAASQTVFGQITNPAPYCASTFATNYNMFDNIKVKGTTLSFGAMGNWMPDNNNTYGYYNATTFPNLKKGDTFSVQINAYAVGDIEPGYFALWIDYNHNNTFENAELILQNSNTIMGMLPPSPGPAVPINKVLTVPATALTGTARVRLMRGTNNAAPFSPYAATFSLVPCPQTQSSGYGCTYDFNVNIIAGSSTGISEAQQAVIPSLEIYPNPAKKIVNVKEDLRATTLVITDAYGKTFNNFKIAGNQIDISALTPGLYFLKAIKGDSISTAKLVIE